MKVPFLEVRVNRNLCLLDFMNRLCPHFPIEPYTLEQKMYGKELKCLVKRFIQRRDHKISYDNLSEFENHVFKELWKEFEVKLKQQKDKIRNILNNEGDIYLLEIAKTCKIKFFPYNRYIIYLIFSKLSSLNPKKYTSTGTYSPKGNSCILTVGIPAHIQLNNAKDLNVLWHELMHSIAPLTKEAILAWEIVVQIYEEIISGKSKKETIYRMTKLFQDNKFTIKEARVLTSFCLSFKWKKYDIFDFWVYIVKKIISIRRQNYKS